MTDFDVRGQDVETAIDRFDRLIGPAWEPRSTPRGRGGSYVYLGVYATNPDWLYVKGGKSDSPWSRASSIATGLPGGLTRMVAVRIRSAADVMAAESRLLNAVNEIAGVEAVGGEWFKVPLDHIEEVVLVLHGMGVEKVNVQIPSRKPYKPRDPDSSWAKETRRRRVVREEIAASALRLAEWKQASTGVSGAFSGVVRG